MGIYCKNRMLMISLALAASGILTCGLALSDVFLPRGSAIIVLVSIPLLGALALGVLIAFAWTCELLDRRGYLRPPRRTACKPIKPWQVASARGPNLDSANGRKPAPMAPMSLRPLIDYPVNVRGTIHFHDNR
ncbi:MAG: hypothetical protein ABSG53_07830 [Thermoguttaceae bacterium]|jgi:hypothetical protein